MATVAETELEQKTSEYAGFVREYFAVTGKRIYSNPEMKVGIDNNYVILEYEGK